MLVPVLMEPSESTISNLKKKLRLNAQLKNDRNRKKKRRRLPHPEAQRSLAWAQAQSRRKATSKISIVKCKTTKEIKLNKTKEPSHEKYKQAK